MQLRLQGAECTKNQVQAMGVNVNRDSEVLHLILHNICPLYPN